MEGRRKRESGEEEKSELVNQSGELWHMGSDKKPSSQPLSEICFFLKEFCYHPHIHLVYKSC